MADYENAGLKAIPTRFEYFREDFYPTTEAPELYATVEANFPDHQREIARTLANFRLWAYTVRFTTLSQLNSGYVTHPKWGMRRIALNVLAPKGIMMETLYHEIFHVLLPRAREDVIEEMGIAYASLINEITGLPSSSSCPKKSDS